MSLCPRRGLLPLLLLIPLALPAPARCAGGVRDEARLFKREAVDQADDAIEEVRLRTHKDVLIETVKKLPQKSLEEYRGLKTEADRADFIRKLAAENARRAGVDGVYVLLCRVPAAEEKGAGLFHLPGKVSDLVFPPQVAGHAVVVWPPTNEKYFPEEDRQKLDAMFAQIKVADRKRNEAVLDDTLLGAVKFAGERLEYNARALGAPPADPFRWTDAAWAAVLLSAAWLVLALVRTHLAARQGTPSPVPPSGYGPAALYGAAGGLLFVEAYMARKKEAGAATAPPEKAAPAPAPDEVAGGVAAHPDDERAAAGPTDLWAPADTEAATGHEPS